MTSETAKMKLITGNTYPVKDKLRAMGGKWNPEQKGWEVPEEMETEARQIVNSASTPNYRPSVCRSCGQKATWGVRGVRWVKVYRNGLCGDCYADRED